MSESSRSSEDRLQPWTIPLSLMVGLAWFIETILVSWLFLLANHEYHITGFIVPFRVTQLLVCAAGLLASIAFVAVFLRNKSIVDFAGSILWNHSGPIILPILFGIVLACLYCVIAKIPADAPFRAAALAIDLSLVILAQVLLAPLLEEVYFRGILYSALSRRLGTAWAFILVTVAFVSVHPKHLLSVLPIAIVLSIVRVKSNSVFSSFLTHASYNLALVLYPLLMSYRL